MLSVLTSGSMSYFQFSQNAGSIGTIHGFYKMLTCVKKLIKCCIVRPLSLKKAAISIYLCPSAFSMAGVKWRMKTCEWTHGLVNNSLLLVTWSLWASSHPSICWGCWKMKCKKFSLITKMRLKVEATENYLRNWDWWNSLGNSRWQ